jgi:4-diphosphocytidyl-2-C-methyl-D-erythritol kinase
VFAALNLPTGSVAASPPQAATDLADAIAHGRNDLEAPAIELQPVIANVLAVLRKLPGCKVARMSGSGATCFGLFDATAAATAAARTLRIGYPAWWVRPTVLGG